MAKWLIGWNTSRTGSTASKSGDHRPRRVCFAAIAFVQRGFLGRDLGLLRTGFAARAKAWAIPPC